MTETQDAVMPGRPANGPAPRPVGVNDILAAVAAGLHDFRAAPFYGLCIGAIYTVAAVVLGAIFIAATIWLGKRPTASASMRVFGYSITYVTVLFGAMTLDVLV